MTCVEAEALLIESLDDAPAIDVRRALDLHVASCAGCAAFAATMRAVDVQLSTALAPLPAPPSIAAAVSRQQRRERFDAFRDTLPDVIHFAGCGTATLLAAAFLPVEASLTLAVGAAVT